MIDETPIEHYHRLSDEALARMKADPTDKHSEFEWLIFALFGHVMLLRREIFDLKEHITELEAKLEA
jgi:hypothetical protein